MCTSKALIFKSLETQSKGRKDITEAKNRKIRAQNFAKLVIITKKSTMEVGGAKEYVLKASTKM